MDFCRPHPALGEPVVRAHQLQQSSLSHGHVVFIGSDLSPGKQDEEERGLRKIIHICGKD